MTMLLPLTIRYHYTAPMGFLRDDIPHYSKRSEMVWRGVRTGARDGEAVRYDVVSKWYNKSPKINVAFKSLECDYRRCNSKKYPGDHREYNKSCMSIMDQLKYKYILSLEGNDVAGNLKWILASNSVPISAPLRTEMWYMEGRLKPWVHYVPIDPPFDDLDSKLQWCIAHPRKCEDIIRNGKIYMMEFSDRDREEKIGRLVLERSMAMINIVD